MPTAAPAQPAPCWGRFFARSGGALPLGATISLRQHEPNGDGVVPAPNSFARTRSVPVLLPSLDSEIRLAFDRLLELAGIRPVILAEVDDMAMLRLLARESEGVALVPPIVVRDELMAGILVERFRIPDFSENFYAIIQKRRFPNDLLSELLSRLPPPAQRPQGKRS